MSMLRTISRRSGLWFRAREEAKRNAEIIRCLTVAHLGGKCSNHYHSTRAA